MVSKPFAIGVGLMGVLAAFPPAALAETELPSDDSTGVEEAARMLSHLEVGVFDGPCEMVNQSGWTNCSTVTTTTMTKTTTTMTTVPLVTEEYSVQLGMLTDVMSFDEIDFRYAVADATGVAREHVEIVHRDYLVFFTFQLSDVINDTMAFKEALGSVLGVNANYVMISTTSGAGRLRRLSTTDAMITANCSRQSQAAYVAQMALDPGHAMRNLNLRLGSEYQAYLTSLPITLPILTLHITRPEYIASGNAITSATLTQASTAVGLSLEVVDMVADAAGGFQDGGAPSVPIGAAGGSSSNGLHPDDTWGGDVWLPGKEYTFESSGAFHTAHLAWSSIGVVALLGAFSSAQ